jgi:uncharacterized protein
VLTVLNEAQTVLRKKGQATPPVHTHKASQGFCGFLGEYQYVVDPHADVYKCFTFVGLKDHCAGTINTEGEIEPLTWAYYDWMSRDPLTIEHCRRCALLPACGGGCAAVAYERHGTYHACGCYDPDSGAKDQLRRYLEREFPQHFKDGKVIWD